MVDRRPSTSTIDLDLDHRWRRFPSPAIVAGEEKKPIGHSMMLAFQKLDVYKVAREIARRVHEAKIGDKELCDQATRAAESTFLQLCEGLPNEGAAMRRKYFWPVRWARSHRNAP